MTPSDNSRWLEQLVSNLDEFGPDGIAALRYLREHRTKVGLHEQTTGARWTIGRRIELHPRFAQGSPADPHALSLVIHEVRHLQQGPWVALSVYGELDAWQLQFRFLRSVTGHYHVNAHHEKVLGELMSLPLNWQRPVLENARRLMQAYAGKIYRIDLLPLYPLPSEIVFRLGGGQPNEH